MSGAKSLAVQVIPLTTMELARKRQAALWSDKGIYGQLERRRGELAKRLPAGFNVDRWLAGLHNEMNRIPKLRQCDPITVIAAAYEIAVLGLQIGGALGQAYIIPFKRQAQLVLGYKGLISLAQEAGIVSGVSGACVYASDEFEHAEGLDPVLRHVPSGKPPGERGERTWVYSVITRANGSRTHRCFPAWQLEKLKRNTPAWRDHEDEMLIKSAFRRALKWERLTPVTARAVELDALAEGGIDQGLELPGELADLDWSTPEIGEARDDFDPTIGDTPSPVAGGAS